MSNTTKRRTLKSIRAGEQFRVIGSCFAQPHTATADAQACGRGYVRVETATPSRETGCANVVVNMSGSTPVEVL